MREINPLGNFVVQSFIVVGLYTSRRAKSACVHLTSPNFLDNKILIICPFPLGYIVTFNVVIFLKKLNYHEIRYVEVPKFRQKMKVRNLIDLLNAKGKQADFLYLHKLNPHGLILHGDLIKKASLTVQRLLYIHSAEDTYTVYIYGRTLF